MPARPTTGSTASPLFSTHMLDLSEQPLAENIATAARYLARIGKMGMTLELEIGITGGEEDAVDNRGVAHERLYTRPSDVLEVYDALSSIGNFNLAAAFGNTHGVYAPGNVELRPDHPPRLAALRRGAAEDRPQTDQLRLPRRLGLASSADRGGGLLTASSR